jgi:two-component system sensor histidine kinase ChiS
MKRGIAEQTRNVAVAAFLEGDLATAAREADDALAEARAIDAPEDTSAALTTEGDLARAKGDAAAAKQAYEGAADLASKSGDGETAAEIDVSLAELALDAGDAAEAARIAHLAIETFSASKNAHDELLARAVVVRALVAEGDASGAAAELTEAEAALPSCQLFRARFLLALAASEVAAARGDPGGAAAGARDALAMASETGMVPYALEARWEQASLVRGAARYAAMSALAKDARAKGFLRVAKLASRR